jgi:hypothetical protein
MTQDYRENHLKLTEFMCDFGHLDRIVNRNPWAD